MGSRFGEEGRQLSYGTYLEVPELLEGKRFYPELRDVRSKL
jgi:hypothetical protein